MGLDSTQNNPILFAAGFDGKIIFQCLSYIDLYWLFTQQSQVYSPRKCRDSNKLSHICRELGETTADDGSSAAHLMLPDSEISQVRRACDETPESHFSLQAVQTYGSLLYPNFSRDSALSTGCEDWLNCLKYIMVPTLEKLCMKCNA